MKHRPHPAPLVPARRPVVAPALAALPFALALAACAGPPLITPIEGEPICPDVELGGGRTKMIGGLRFPVQITIKEGSSVKFEKKLVGLRSSKDLASRVLLPDDDATYTVEWAQCENERAPKPVTQSAGPQAEIAQYECGKAASYKTEELKTKKGDATSHRLTFAAPPNPACWQSTIQAPPADAGAPDAAPEDAGAGAAADPDAGTGDAGADAGPTDADAGAADTDGGAADAGPAAADAGATAPDAGSTDPAKGAASPH